MARIKGPWKLYRYTDEFKLNAVKLTQLQGVQVKDVAEALEIHPWMHALVASVLLRFSRLDELGQDAQAHPPRRQARQPREADRCKGRSIIGADPLRQPDVSVYRQVTFFSGRVHETYPHTKAMKARIDSRPGRARYARRLGIVEPVFGNLHTHGLTRFTLRTRRKVDTQWKLYCLTHNIQKLMPHAA